MIGPFCFFQLYQLIIRVMMTFLTDSKVAQFATVFSCEVPMEKTSGELLAECT